jgi:hypothetical protein
MKSTFISVIALGVAVAMAGPVDRAAAGEPMVLTDAELDRVTAGSLLVLEVQAPTVLPVQDGTSNTVVFVETPIPPSDGASAPQRRAEFVIIRIGHKINHALPPGER